MADARRSTDDPSHLDWISRVYDGTAVSEHEAAMLTLQLYHRLDHLEQALSGHDFLVGDRSAADPLGVPLELWSLGVVCTLYLVSFTFSKRSAL
jgi:hypothetical protein